MATAGAAHGSEAVRGAGAAQGQGQGGVNRANNGGHSEPSSTSGEQDIHATANVYSLQVSGHVDRPFLESSRRPVCINAVAD